MIPAIELSRPRTLEDDLRALQARPVELTTSGDLHPQYAAQALRILRAHGVPATSVRFDWASHKLVFELLEDATADGQ